MPHEKDDLMIMHLERWLSSGSTQIAYCHQQDIPVHIFSYYKKKLGYGSVQIQSTQPDSPQLIPVELLSESEQANLPSIQVCHENGFFINIRPDSDLQALKPVLELLRSLS